MAVLPIRITGDPVLHSPARPVETIDDEVRTLVADLFETMDAAPGVGLAAPQVGVDLRVFTYGWTDEEGVRWRGVAINPELLISPPPPGEPDLDEESEGCLSFPGERFGLRRAERAVLRATGLDGERYETDAQGWLARIFQHEYDHLDGVLYTDRLSHADRKIVGKITKKLGWGRPGVSWMPGVDDLEG
ncbi:peptide deformylase [Agromyces mediolanus]|uniref:peptide deformylase n=1 Tax=Agromyces mediolanus TaxID=41986 RepID=UPI002040D8A2|nr:peptide deformylase [Agromyces mediolanus]MCM3659041.1 peptide deformylase [Agromyces mediolanus]